MQACLCVGVGSGGVQTCKADGSGWDLCACPDSGSGGAGGADAAADAVADVAQDVSVDAPIDALADGASDAADAGDVSIDAVADASSDAIPDVSQDVVGDLGQETTVDASLDVAPDAADAADATFDVSQDVVADVAQDVFVGVCTPAEKRCGGPGSLQPQECDATGQWQDLGAACAFECTGVGTCTRQSCAGGGDGLTNCGPSASENCCASPSVSGGTFSRSYDAVYYTDPGFHATLSDFRLDKYEITVGRFRKFVDAWVAGWTPPAGSGRHAHLNSGSGLNAGAGVYEPGWDVTWNARMPTAKAYWDMGLICNATYATWTATPGANESLPINCINWHAAEAFCIWDGGFLPSEAEWNYAAAGGAEQRVYPWSSPASSTTIDCSYAKFSGGLGCSSSYTVKVGLESPTGDGKWGQADLAGNVWEWTLDTYSAGYETLCTDCAHLPPPSSSSHVTRGGGFGGTSFDLLVSSRDYGTSESGGIGARCARTP